MRGAKCNPRKWKATAIYGDEGEKCTITIFKRFFQGACPISSL